MLVPYNGAIHQGFMDLARENLVLKQELHIVTMEVHPDHSPICAARVLRVPRIASLPCTALRARGVG